MGASASWASGRVVDLTGCTLLSPGFIDAHVHLTGTGSMLGADDISAFAQNGVTTVWYMECANGGSVEDFIAAVATYSPAYPRVISTGKFISQVGTYGSVHPQNGHIGVIDPSEVAGVIRREAEVGCRGIKTSMDRGPERDLPPVPRRRFKAICREAKAFGLWTAAHVTESVYVAMAVDCGLDILAHVALDPLPDELIATIVERNVSVIPTLSLRKGVYRVRRPSD